MLFKFPVEQIVRRRFGTDCLCHPAAGLGLPDGAIQAVLTHEPLDFLHIHHDRLRQMQQPHMDTANALGVAPELVCLQNQREILLVPLLPRPPYILCIHPAVIPGTGHARDPPRTSVNEICRALTSYV